MSSLMTVAYSSIIFLIGSVTLVAGTALPPPNSVTLAVDPVCGSYGGSPKDVKGNLPELSTFTTIVTFGDSYTDGGKHNGSALEPPLLHQPNPSAAGRYTNGPVWAEYLANVSGATLKDYAVQGAVVDVGQWPGSDLLTSDDLLTQANTFISQPARPPPTSTLFILFFGIEDYERSSDNGNSSLSNQAQNIAYTILNIASYPVYGKNFLVIDNHGRGSETTSGAAFKSELFQYLGDINSNGMNVGFVDLSTVWNGVLSTSPGYEAFGYISKDTCLVSLTTTVGSCADPDHTFYWFPGNPTTVTHKLISDYIQAVWEQC